jgi:uncharacterized protein (TIGR02996 family)
MPNPVGDELALLKAVASAPDDDLPRLVYADWLDEHNRPERAEFIRLQIADERGTARAGREQRRVWVEEMLAEHRDAWCRELPRWVRRWYGDHRWEHPTFRRGFIAELSVYASPFLAFGDRLLDRTPLESLDVYHLRALRRELADCPWLGGVPHLNLSHESLEEEGARAFARNRNLHGVRALNLRGCGLCDAGVRALADAVSLTGLKSLDLGSNDLTVAAAKALRGAAFLRTLEVIDLARNPQLRGHEDRIRGWLGERVRFGG